MKTTPSLSMLTLAGLLAATTQCLQAQSIVTNGGFETGDFSGWNQTPAASGSFFGVDGPAPALNYSLLPSGAYEGNDYAFFGATGTQADSIDQLLATTPGYTYDVNFWVNDSAGGANFTATWGGVQLTSFGTDTTLPGSGNNGWTEFDFPETATSASTDLAFAAYSGNILGLDDVTVTATPEPGTLALTGLGAVALLAVRRFRAR